MGPAGRLIAVLLAACVLPAVGRAESDLLDRTLSAADKERLAAYDTVRRQAIDGARKGGEPDQVALLDAILAGTPQPLRGESLLGDYRCRVAKLDGVLPLVVYDWFRCAIDEDDLGYRLVKLTGSQRLTLHFVDDGESRLVAYGAGHYADEPPRAYGADPERDTVGVLVKAEGGRYRVEFPLPRVESRFDILELERR
jgi:hypothetical protein